MTDKLDVIRTGVKEYLEEAKQRFISIEIAGRGKPPTEDQMNIFELGFFEGTIAAFEQDLEDMKKIPGIEDWRAKDWGIKLQ